eukprot:6598653-Prymnesium_polylepis.1
MRIVDCRIDRCGADGKSAHASRHHSHTSCRRSGGSGLCDRWGGVRSTGGEREEEVEESESEHCNSPAATHPRAGERGPSNVAAMSTRTSATSPSTVAAKPKSSIQGAPPAPVVVSPCASEPSAAPAHVSTSPTDVRGEPIGTPTREPGRGRSALVQPRSGGDGRGVRGRPSERGGVWKRRRSKRGGGGDAGLDCTTCENDRGGEASPSRSRFSTRPHRPCERRTEPQAERGDHRLA